MFSIAQPELGLRGYVAIFQYLKTLHYPKLLHMWYLLISICIPGGGDIWLTSTIAGGHFYSKQQIPSCSQT